MNQQQLQSTTGERDATAIASLYQQMLAAWNAGDGAAFAAPFTDDADYVAFDGSHSRGRQTIAELHQQLFDTYLKGTRLVGKVRSVRFLTPDVALMHAVGGTVLAGQTDLDPERNSIQTLVAVHTAEGWRLAAFHNTRAHFMGRADEVQRLTDELRQEL